MNPRLRDIAHRILRYTINESDASEILGRTLRRTPRTLRDIEPLPYTAPCGSWRCSTCRDLATCFGDYAGDGFRFACDECCKHDYGWCVPVQDLDAMLSELLSEKTNNLIGDPRKVRALHRYEYSLLEACEALHMGTTGASDIKLDHMRALAGLIQERLEEWEERNNNWKTYDNAVKLLCSNALAYHIAACFCMEPPVSPVMERE